jgi:hypothetical protein
MSGRENFFRKDHLESHKFNASATLAEQAVHCLELVSELVETGLPFQFKGGNSLLLILDEPKRFSIDVDIATFSSREEIEMCLNVCVKRFGVFYRWMPRQHKTKPWLPIASYYLFYRSHFDSGEETSIMLDVQLRRTPYETEFKSIVCRDIYRSDAKTELPLPSSIISDKLLTLGPNTLGIPLGKGKEAQRLKHVFDVARLLQTKPPIDKIRESFISCLEHENEIQEGKQSADAVIKDTLDFCWSVVPYVEQPLRGDVVSDITQENANGLAGFAGHLFDSGYSWKQLQIDTAKVAVCVTALSNTAIDNRQFLDALDGVGEKYALKSEYLSKNHSARTYWEIMYQWSGVLPDVH